MAGSNSGLHESPDDLNAATVDRHRAIVSLMEELEAVDTYDQRVDATTDRELTAVLEHNRDEEKEHAAMALEWLRRHDPMLDQHLRTYLFTDVPITATEEAVESQGVEADAVEELDQSETSLGIGSLKGTGAR